MFHRADAAIGAVNIQARPTRRLAKRHLRRHATRSGLVKGLHGGGRVAHDVPHIERVFHGRGVNGWHIGMQFSGAVKFAQNAHNAARAVHIFDMVFVGIGRNFAQLRHDARQAVNIRHAEIDSGFLRNRQQMQNRVGRTAHRNIERHGVFKGFHADGTGQHGNIVLLVIALAQFDDEMTRFFEQRFTVSVRRHNRAVTGQG